MVELTRQQQHDWSVNPSEVYQQLEWPMFPVVTTPTEPLTSLDITHVDGRDDYDGWTSLSGICIAESQTTPFQMIRNCAVRAQYFRPQLPRPVTQMWYHTHSLNSTRTDLPFHFPPLFSEKNPQTFHGTVVVFLQLFTADDWVKNVGCPHGRRAGLPAKVVTKAWRSVVSLTPDKAAWSFELRLYQVGDHDSHKRQR